MRGGDRLDGSRVAALRQRAGAGGDAEPLEEDALRQRAMAARRARGSGQRAETDVGGEVGLAGVGERVGAGVAAERLERVAGALAGAVVDGESRAAAGRDAAAEVGGD